MNSFLIPPVIAISIYFSFKNAHSWGQKIEILEPRLFSRSYFTYTFRMYLAALFRPGRKVGRI